MFLDLLTVLMISAQMFTEATMIYSDRITDFGKWGPLDQCPEGTFVKAINIKVEGNQGFWKDDTALNAVKLSCVKLEDQVTGPSFPVAKFIKSSEGPWGYYRGPEFCHRGIAIGFRIRSEDGQGPGDDTAANDMVLICATSDGEYLTSAKGSAFGSWRSNKKCPARTAICGLETQVEPPQGNGLLFADDSSLNNVNALCCDLPNPAKTCKATDDWVKIDQWDNTQGTGDMPFSSEKTTGVSTTVSKSDYTSVLDEFAVSVGFGVSAEIFGALGLNFETTLSTSTKTQHAWSESDTSVFKEETKETLKLVIPAHCNVILYQVFGKCGSYLVKSNTIKRVDKCLDGTTETIIGGGSTHNGGHHPFSAVPVLQLIMLISALRFLW